MLQPSYTGISEHRSSSVTFDRIIIAGHSHAVALGVPLQTPDNQETLAPLEHDSCIVFGLTGAWPRGDDYWSALTELDGNNLIILVWQGNQHLSSFLFEREPSFDFFLTEHSDYGVDPQKLIVPEELIRQFFLETIVPLDKILKTLSASGRNKTIVLGTPPPKRDNEKLAARLNTEPHFSNWAQMCNIDLNDARLTSPHLRLKLWYVIQDLLKDTAYKNLVDFISVPESVKNEAGFLKEIFWEADVTHANRQYGTVVFDHIFRLYSNRLKAA